MHNNISRLSHPSFTHVDREMPLTGCTVIDAAVAARCGIGACNTNVIRVIFCLNYFVFN